MIRRLVLLCLICLLAAPSLASALTVRDVAREVRCPTCNTPLDVSSAPVALDMKQYIQKRIEAGWSKQRIIDGLVDEFGTQVLATPPKSGFDLIAWIVPALAVRPRPAPIPDRRLHFAAHATDIPRERRQEAFECPHGSGVGGASSVPVDWRRSSRGCRVSDVPIAWLRPPSPRHWPRRVPVAGAT